MRFFSLSLLLALLMAACGCSSRAEAQKPDLSQGLPLPQVPATIIDPRERADYATEHFWEAMDFADNDCALDSAFMEQAFANYAYIMQQGTQGQPMQQKVDALVAKASVNPEAREYLAKIAESYLFSPDSPVYSEEAYAYFIRAFDPYASDIERSVLASRLESINLNRPGSQPNDFNFVDTKGRQHSFGQLVQGRNTLAIFYYPDCDDCLHEISTLGADPWLNNLIADGKIQVAAIAPADYRELWQATAATMPANWTIGCDVTDIEGKGLYEIVMTPTLFLIGSDGKVVMKNRPLDDVIECIYQLWAK